MFPNSSLPQYGTANIQVFNAIENSTTTNSWVTWNKPQGCSWVYMLMIAAGGGGGKGAGGAATVAPGGGGSGGHSRLWIPAFLLPDTLFIRVGNGGLGATTSANGSAGTQTYICVQPNTTAANILMTQPGGGGGAGAAAATAGTAGSAGTATGAVWQGIGLWVSVAGQAGTAGSAAANGAVTAITPGASGIITTGGAGGGNGTAAGGAITAAGFWPAIAGGVGTTGGAGNNGFNQDLDILIFRRLEPLRFSGGTGGGGHTTGQSGAGGFGGLGGGGGGGGNSSGAGGLAGNGGNGGDGVTIIMAG